MSGASRREMLLGLAGTLGLTAISQAEPSAAGRVAGASEYMLEPGLIYLNTGSLGPTPRAVLDAVIKAWTELETNPVKMSYGEGAVHTVADKTRNTVAGLIGCAADEVLLTRSTTNAMNIAALGINLARGDRVLTTDSEHEGGSACWKYLEKRVGIAVDRVVIAPEDHDVRGIVERFAAAIKNETKVVSVSHIIFSTGLRMPVREIVSLAKAKNILTIVDGAQAVGNTDVDVKAIGCDAYAAPGHKWLMAPKGTGFLYVNKDAATKVQPVEWTDAKTYVASSAGIGSLPLIVGLGAAIEMAQKRSVAASETRNLRLRNRAYEALKKITKLRVLSAPPGPLATTLLTFRLPDGVEHMPFFTSMRDKHKVMLRGVPRLKAMRLSPHVFNTEADIDTALKAITSELRI
jgi:selenocysteine lyase/cysteine desulfurase